MNVDDLPVGPAPEPVEFKHFPAAQQAVIWRNWEMLPVKTLADVLDAPEEEIVKAAGDMGLPLPPCAEPKWLALGYVTIIRANWHLLPYEQLLQLLGWSPEKLAFHLKEDDFLWHKLGDLKPCCDRVKYRQLTPEESEKTRCLKETVHSLFGRLRGKESPFTFAERLSSPDKSAVQSIRQGRGKFGSNFICSYFTSFGDPLMSSAREPFSEGILKRYADMGVGGIWLQAILYTLCPIPGAVEYSERWEERLENLRELISRASAYGIKVYLYLNEPRGMSAPFFDKLPSWKGTSGRRDDVFALCTSNSEVLEWLSYSCRHLFSEAPGLGGAFTITMSENLTNCHSKGNAAACPRCAGRPPQEIVAEVNCAIEKGVHAAAPDAQVISWNWGWEDDWEHEAVDLLPENVEVMCVSERGKELNIGGISNRVGDYSLSCPGPSSRSLSLWEHAKSRGLKTVAKVQLNNSWECSALPYIPVPYLIEEHLENLRKTGVDGLMLSWSLGGYPGGNLELLDKSPEEIALENFGEPAAEPVMDAWKIFGEAFRNFPFNVQVLYTAPQNMGPANPLFMEATGYKATMVGLPYDDLRTWRANYPEDVFENQFRMMSEQWSAGVARLCEAENLVREDAEGRFALLKAVAEAAFCHFRSAYNQIRFVRIREKTAAASISEIQGILDEEIGLARRLHEIVLDDSTIGFEAANHYAYTANDLVEKAINCVFLKKLYGGEKNES